MTESSEDWETIMQEAPGGSNHGRAAVDGSGYDPFAPDAPGRVTMERGLDLGRPVELDWLYSNGFSIVDTSAGSTSGRVHGARDAGMSAHRGVLHPDEYVNHEAVLRDLERHLGYTVDQVRSVYTRLGGPIPTDQRQLRDQIDSRMLALSRSGANMTLLRQLLGITEVAIWRAVSRARGKEQA